MEDEQLMFSLLILSINKFCRCLVGSVKYNYSIIYIKKKKIETNLGMFTYDLDFEVLHFVRETYNVSLLEKSTGQGVCLYYFSNFANFNKFFAQGFFCFKSKN